MDFPRYPFKPVNRPTPPRDPLASDSPNVRFCAVVDYIVTKHKLPPEFNNDYIPFLRLAIHVLSAKKVMNKCRTAFQSFLNVVPKLPEDARKTMCEALTFFRPDPAVAHWFNQLRRSLDSLDLKEQERIKLEQVELLRFIENARLTYEGWMVYPESGSAGLRQVRRRYTHMSTVWLGAHERM